jgi:hypothetical protein
LDEYCYRNRVIPPLIRRQLYAPATLTGFQQATPTTFRDIGNKAPAFEIKYAQEYFEPEKVRENVGLQTYNALAMLPKNEVLSRDRAASIITGAINYQIGLIRAARIRRFDTPAPAEAPVGAPLEAPVPPPPIYEAPAPPRVYEAPAPAEAPVGAPLEAPVPPPPIYEAPAPPRVYEAPAPPPTLEQEIERVRRIRLRRTDSGVEERGESPPPPPYGGPRRARTTSLELRQRAAETITRELGRVISRRREMVNQQVQAVSELSGKVSQEVIDDAITNVITRAQTGVAVEKLIANVIARNPELTPEGRARGIKIFKEASEAGKLRLERLDNVAREESRAALDTIITQLEAEEDVVNRMLDEVFMESGVEGIYVEAIAEEAGAMGFAEEKQEEPKFRIAVNPQDEIDRLEEEINETEANKQANAKQMIRLDNDITQIERKIRSIQRDIVRKSPERRPRFQEQLRKKEEQLTVLQQHMADMKKQDTFYSSEIETNREIIEQFREDLKEL